VGEQEEGVMGMIEAKVCIYCITIVLLTVYNNIMLYYYMIAW